MAKLGKGGRNYEMDMCSGPLLSKIIIFSLPLIASGILQLLYNAADIVVVGKFAGSVALAAVGSTGSLINLITSIFMGLSVGVSVVVAQTYGAANWKDVSEAVHTSITVAAISGVAVGIFGVIFAKPLLHLMGSPDDVIDLAALYLRIYFLGMPASMIYNYGAGVLRAVGDTRRPMYFLAISGAVNVVFNLIFVIIFHLDTAGVALATIISQYLSAIMVVVCLMRSNSSIKLDLRRLTIRWAKLKEILRVGLPAGVQGSLFALSNVLIQSTVNSFGSVVMAGNAAAGNIEGFIWMAMNCIYQAAITFVGQNMGAKKYERINRITWTCEAVVVVIGLIMGTIAIVFGRQFLSIYSSDPEVIEKGLIRMNVICLTYFTCGIMDTMVGVLRGMGHSLFPMIISLAGACGFRILWIYTIFQWQPTLRMLYLSYPASWVLTAAMQVITYLVVKHKLDKRVKAEAEQAAIEE